MARINLELCMTVGMLKYSVHDVTKIEYADFFTCEEVYDPADDRKVVTLMAVSEDKIFVFIA